MIKKDAQDLVERLDDIHARLEDIIQDYMNEYAPYGWDATCTDIVNIAALKEYCEPYPHIYKAMSRAMADAPSIDIVRCRECKHREEYPCKVYHDDDWYCADGEREGE